MADLVEVPQWDAGIYQIEQTDPVLGGPPDLGNDQGITNVPAQQLANRTVYLLDLATTLETAVAALEAILSSGGFTDNIEVSGVNPSILLTDTDQGAATNQAHLTLSGGVLFMQAESGIISLTGLANTNLNSLTAKFEGVYQEVLHNGMMATQVQAEDGVTGGVWMDDIRVKQAIDAHPLSPRAFVNFDMNGGVPIIASSQGVASVSQSSSGVYQINWENAFSSAGYAVVCTMVGGASDTRYPNIRGIAASYVRVGNSSDNTISLVCVVAFGDLA